MLRLGGQRFTVKPSALPEMDALFDDLPNFAEVLEDIRKHLALCIDSNDSVELPPMLLLGEPGIGKTHFARKLAELLGTGFGFVPMSSLTAGWVLSGASSQWKNAKPGKVFDTFLNGDYANPGDRGRRARQGERATASTIRSARSTSCSRSRPRRASSTSSSSCRSTPRAPCGSPPRTTRRASPSRC